MCYTVIEEIKVSHASERERDLCVYSLNLFFETLFNTTLNASYCECNMGDIGTLFVICRYEDEIISSLHVLLEH